MKELISDYERILAGVKPEYFDLTQDQYSGVFLPLPFEEYWRSYPKVMLVGRETAGWNTKNGKNTIRRVIKANERGDTREIGSFGSFTAAEVFVLDCSSTGHAWAW